MDIHLATVEEIQSFRDSLIYPCLFDNWCNQQMIETPELKDKLNLIKREEI